MMRYLFLFLSLPVGVFAQDKPTCPSESFLIEYRSPTTKGMKYTCAYLKNGQTIKHGEEWSFDSQNQLMSKFNFFHGVTSSLPMSPSTSQPVEGDVEEKKLRKSIADFLKILTFQTSGSEPTKFKVDGCDKDSMAWVKAALMKSSLNRSYSFSERCDAAGSFVASFSQEFPISMQLRNLDDLDSTTMKVIMIFDLKAGNIHYKFEVLEGKLSSAKRSARFTAKYQVQLNPMSGEPLKNTQSGELNLTEVNGKEAKATVPLFYD